MASPRVVWSAEPDLSLISKVSLQHIETSLGVPFLIKALFLSGLMIWATWWIFKFKISPKLYPDDPAEVPYIVPILGHAFSFFKNSTALITAARLGFGNTREPFAITLAGSKLYVLTSYRDATDAYKNMTTFSYEVFVQEMMRWCGSTDSCIEKMYQPARDTVFPNPKERPLAILARDMHIHQLFPGANLDDLAEKFHKNLTKLVTTDSLQKYKHEHLRVLENYIIVPLNAWVSDCFVRAGTDAYFGPKLLKLDSDLVNTFLEFDDLSWQVMYQYPRIFAGSMYAARDRLTSTIEDYFTIDQSERDGDAWFTKAMEDEMRRLGITNHDLAIMMMTIHWGINTNTRRATFWMLSYLLQDPALIQEIRKETAAAFSPEGALNYNYNVRDLPRFMAVWNETIRLTASSTSVRYIAEDTVIGNKLLRKGNRILIPNQQLHMDESVFGANVESFDGNRFFKNEQLLRSPSWRPFGGGITICPGRFIALQATFIFIALVLDRFEIEKAMPNQPFPERDTGTPVLGVMANTPGTEFMVKLRPIK